MGQSAATLQGRPLPSCEATKTTGPRGHHVGLRGQARPGSQVLNQDAWRGPPPDTDATGAPSTLTVRSQVAPPEQKGEGSSPALNQVLRVPQPTPLIMRSLIKMNHFVLCAVSLFRRRRDRSVSSLPAHWPCGLGLDRHRPSAEDSSSSRLIPRQRHPSPQGRPRTSGTAVQRRPVSGSGQDSTVSGTGGAEYSPAERLATRCRDQQILDTGLAGSRGPPKAPLILPPGLNLGLGGENQVICHKQAEPL